MARASLDLIDAMYEIAEARKPISVRGVAYKLFTAGLIRSMKKGETAKVSRLLTIAREKDVIPWEWIVDETRELERGSYFRDPDEYVRVVRNAYRRDFWIYQDRRVEVWSEKGTMRGVLAPVLEEFGVGFRVLHGFGSATSLYEVAQERNLIALYVGDWDPSGLYMSERDLPERLERYGAIDVTVQRVALLPADLDHLPSFSADTKKGDTRYEWFVGRFGRQCWEVDAMDENALRQRVEESIREHIEPEAWARCEIAQEAEQESLESLLDKWVAA
jgi:hypothetical protein